MTGTVQYRVIVGKKEPDLVSGPDDADLEDIPEDVRRELEIVPTTRIGEVLDAALERLVANPPPPLPATQEQSAGQTESEPLRVRPA